MSNQTTVAPKDIEKGLNSIWDTLAEKNKMRACLFNLVVFNKQNKRTPYVKDITKRVIEKFPCRIIFISSEQNKQDQLTTKVSVMASEQSSIICDHIEITFSGKEEEKIPFLILPHIIPDLPIYLLWADDPSLNNSLLQKLQKFTTRTIFDSESAKDLNVYSDTILDIAKTTSIADLNWARTESWRDLLSSSFHTKDAYLDLQKSNKIFINYNAFQTDFFTKSKTQALFLQSWLSSRLNWKFKQASNEKDQLKIEYTKSDNTLVAFYLIPNTFADLKAATILSLEIITDHDKHFQYLRNKQYPHQVTVHVTTKDICEIPYQFIIEKTTAGRSLAKEIYCQGTSTHYILMLKNLIQLDKEYLC